LTIRTWTEEEIQQALEAKRLEPKDVNRAKSNCPADITLHWGLSESRPPRARVFQLSDNEPQLEDHSQPTA